MKYRSERGNFALSIEKKTQENKSLDAVSMEIKTPNSVINKWTLAI